MLWAQGLFDFVYSWHRSCRYSADCHVSLCHSFFPIGDNITMLTTADWLLGSNSQSAAGLSTLSDKMKGQYLVFSPLSQWKHSLYFAFLNCQLHSWRHLFCPKNTLIHQLQNSKIASTIVPFIQKLFGICCNCCGILF